MIAISPAFDFVVSDPNKPAACDGGPCDTCAFRVGTEANRADYTTLLARLCVEGVTPFDCHERPGFCHGWQTAVNLRQLNGELSDGSDAVRYREAMRAAADILGACIDAAKSEDSQAMRALGK